MTDVIISIAHGPHGDQAIDGLFNEYTLSLMWSTFLELELKRREISCRVINLQIFTTKARVINRNKPKLCLEIHFNDFKDPTVEGAETLYDPGSYRGGIYARIMQEQISQLPNRDRGIKEGWYRGREGHRIHFLHSTSPPALIIEPGFISEREKLIEMAPMGMVLIANAIEAILSKEIVIAPVGNEGLLQ